jgi:hypothetical protein
MNVFNGAFAGLLAAVSIPAPADAAPPAARTGAAMEASGLHDFDFMFGDWRVQHRVPKAGTHEWTAFDGTSTTRPIMGGAGNLEDNVLNRDGGSYRAAAVRAYDAKTALWAIWWVDGRNPHGSLDPPVKGRFENGVGRFYSDYVQNGKPMRLRYTWTHATPTRAHWEQAASSDGGATWATNWTMEFTRNE